MLLVWLNGISLSFFNLYALRGMLTYLYAKMLLLKTNFFLVFAQRHPMIRDYIFIKWGVSLTSGDDGINRLVEI